MKAVVAGGGAMGCLYAGQFARHGTDVMVLDAADAVVAALRDNGVRLVRDSGDVTSAVQASSDPAAAGTPSCRIGARAV